VHDGRKASRPPRLVTMPAKIDVLLPVKNGMPYLQEALDSIQAQTIQDFRVLILDHSSTDGSAELAMAYHARDPRFVHCPLPEAVGLSGLLNAGLDLCSAPFIARQDADDVSLPSRFALSLAAMEADLNIAVLGGDAEIIDADGKHQGEMGMPASPDGLLPYFFFFNPVAHPTVMLSHAWMKKQQARYGKDFLNVLPAAQQMRVDNFAEDYFLFGQLVLTAKVVNLPDKLIRYRWHGQNTGKQKYFEQVATSLRVARYLAACYSTIHQIPLFDPAPFTTTGHRLVRFTGQPESFDNAYEAMRKALEDTLHGHEDFDRQMALRKVYANRKPMTMLLRALLYVLKYKWARHDIYPVYSYVFHRFASQRTPCTSDNGININ
jgi:glycosyltransferase involved in cell wall biosynthesis